MAVKTLRKLTVIAFGMVSAMLILDAGHLSVVSHAQEITELILGAAGR